MKMHIYDMDGTIVDSSHRYRTVTGEDGRERIDLAYWLENEYRAMEDSLLPLASQYQDDLASGSVFVVIATARVMNDPDMQFLREVLGMPHRLISRKNRHDMRGGAQLKIAGLAQLFNLKQFDPHNAVFFEDNASYLKTVCDRFGMRGVYVPSKQGH